MNNNLVMLVFMVILALGVVGVSTPIADVFGLTWSSGLHVWH